EDVYGKGNVKSTTVVKNPRSTVNNRILPTGEHIDVITSGNGKAVKITAKDEFGNMKEIANIPYDSRGFPIFDDVAKFTTTIKTTENYTNSSVRRRKEMINATLELKNKILDGTIDKSLFNKIQLEQIMKGKDKIDGFTWHHNAQSSPNNMQLVPTNIHDPVKHIGEGALSEGR
ncbi:HNH endonuclease, partial [Rodentibacter trehalosifermentans]